MRLFRSSAIAAIVALTTATGIAPIAAQAQVFVGVSVSFAPPPLPVYQQPPIPGSDYVWIPGYWAWDDDYYDYYWVPGTWAPAPEPGLLWTPAWWGWNNGVYAFHEGYWAPHVGFYGGVSYGFGYNGSGYEGGYWQNNHFFYNRTVNNVTNVNITNVYNKTVIINRTAASFNGPGGVTAQPTPQQMAVAQERHVPPTQLQTQNAHAAAALPSLHASANHGAPPVAAAAKPAAFNGPGVIKAAQSGGSYHPPAAAIQRQAQARAAHGQTSPSPAAPADSPPRPGDRNAPVADAARRDEPKTGRQAPRPVGEAQANDQAATPRQMDRGPDAAPPSRQEEPKARQQEPRPGGAGPSPSRPASGRDEKPQDLRAPTVEPHGDGQAGMRAPARPPAARPHASEHHAPPSRPEPAPRPAPPRPPAPHKPPPRPEEHQEPHR